jgi:DNA-binding SARP family transcriptional activator
LLLERRKTRALLAMLALDPGHTMLRGKIAALLWGEQDEDAARHALRQCLLDLRQVLAKTNLPALRVEGDAIGLEPSRLVVDVARFERQVAHGTPGALQEAVTLYRGDLLEGFSVKEQAFEDWLRTERERLRSLAVRAMKTLLAHYERRQAPDPAVQLAVRLLALEPFDEAVHRALMRLYGESGRRSAALRQYEECVEILARELGAEPEAETRELYRRLVSERARPVQIPASAGIHRRRISRASKTRPPSPPIAQMPLIGREADLRWLDTFRRRVGRGQPQLLLLVGEAGIGKSRLVTELATRARRRRAEVLLGRGREGESVLAFAPWIEALRPALGVRLVKHLPTTIRRDLARLFPEIENGPSPPPGGLEDGARIFEAVAHLLRQLASRRPIVVVIEDLHWCDDMTVRLLRFLPRRLEARPVLLVGTARPEDIPTDAVRGVVLDTLSRDPTCVSRTLEPLSRDESTQLLRALLALRDEELPAALVERTWSLSEGNPFVVVECARAVRRRGAASSDTTLELPDQVRVLTTRCFASLSNGAARLADVAAVIGRDFDAAVLGLAAALTESEVADGVEELVRCRVLREVGGRFDFGHDRMREVAYTRLLGPRRTLLHRQVAHALEAVYSADLDSYSAVIGTHYREAGDWNPACRYLASAGFQASARGAVREALACFEKALEGISQVPDTEQWRDLHVQLRLAANGASIATRSYERGRQHLHEADKLTPNLADQRLQCRVAAALSLSYLAAGVLDQSLVLGERALAIACATDQPELAAVARYVLGQCESTAGNFHRSLELLDQSFSHEVRGAESSSFYPAWKKPRGMLGSIRYGMMINFMQLGEFDAGRRVAESSFREADTLNDPLGTLRLHAYVGLGKLETCAGDLGAAVRAYESAWALYREDFHGDIVYPTLWGLALAYVLTGRAGKGFALFDRAAEIQREAGDSSVFPYVRLLHHALALITVGRLEDADRVAAEALSLARERGNRPSEAGAHGLLGEVARLRDPCDHESMKHHIQAALTLAEALEMRPLAARCHSRLAWLQDRIGGTERDRHAAASRWLLDRMGEHVKVDAAGVH